MNKLCHWTNEELITANDGYAGEWIPRNFLPCYELLRQHKKVMEAYGSFCDDKKIQKKYQVHIDKLAQRINSFLDENPRYKERAKSMFWDVK